MKKQTALTIAIGLSLWALILGVMLYCSSANGQSVMSLTVENKGTCPIGIRVTYWYWLPNSGNPVLQGYYSFGGNLTYYQAPVGFSYQINVNIPTGAYGGYFRSEVQGGGTVHSSTNDANASHYVSFGTPGACVATVCQSTNRVYTVNIVNNSTAYKTYQAKQDGVPLEGGYGAGWIQVPPGGSDTMTFSVRVGCGVGTDDVKIYDLQGALTYHGSGESQYVTSEGGETVYDDSPEWTADLGTGSGGSPSSPSERPPAPKYNPTNNLIEFSAEAATNIIAATKESSETLYQAITDADKNAQTSAKSLEKLLDRELKNIAATTQNGTEIVSNRIYLTGQQIQNILTGSSNTAYNQMRMLTNYASVQTNLLSQLTNIETRTLLSNSLFNSAMVGAINDGTIATTNGLNSLGTSLSNSFYNAISGLSTNLGGTSTNGSLEGVDGIIDAVSNFHGDNTNFLGQILERLTPTNNPVSFNTNLASLQTEGEAIVSELETATAALSGASPPIGGTAGGGSLISIPIGGLTMSASLMPGEWAQVWGFARSLIEWLLVAGYLYLLAKGVFEVIKGTGQAQQMTLPNMNILGTNTGATLYPVIVVLVLGMWGIILGAIGTYVTGSGVWLTKFTNGPLAGHGGNVANGIAYLLNAIPFDTMFGLAGAKIVWELTKAKAIALASVIMRLIPG